jgi:hypothetical protein
MYKKEGKTVKNQEKNKTCWSEDSNTNEQHCWSEFALHSVNFSEMKFQPSNVTSIDINLSILPIDLIINI